MKKTKFQQNSLRIDSANSSKFFTKIQAFSKEHFPSKLSIAQYRMLYSDSYSDQLQYLTSTCNSSTEIMKSLIPLALYYLNCNLPFFQLIEKVDSTLLDIPCPNDLFHILFQNSEMLLRAIYIHHYSFSNPIPFYYPIIKEYSKKKLVDYTICKELWYSLTPHNAVISFGIGNAANNPIGKSTLLDIIFELNLAPNSISSSGFHYGSIDLRLTKNFFPGVPCDPYHTNWAFFDVHSPTNVEIVKLMLKHVEIVIIHILERDLIKNSANINRTLQSFNLKGKQIFIFIRDVLKDEKTKKYLDENIYTVVRVPKIKNNLRGNGIRLLGKLKMIGSEIIELRNKIKVFTAHNLEEILKQFDPKLFEEVMKKRKFLNSVSDAIIKTLTLKKNEINYEFLSYYPTFVKLMKKKYEILGESDVEKVEELNKQCSQYFKVLNDSKICFVVNEIFQKIISDEDSVLILWKLSQELQILTNEFSIKGALREQANDKYSIEILWREAILSQKYFHRNTVGSGNLYNETLSTSMSSLIQTGEPFELIDGDNLVFFSKELNSMFRYFHVRQTEFIRKYNADNPGNTITEAPLVLSIIGPQSSGKSTLLNYVFGSKFLTSTGRCTRGVYGSLLELNKPINKSKFLLVLDTEGIDSVERSSAIHFDRTLILFCLSVSNVVIINLIGELNNEMQELMKICAYSLNHLKVHRTTMPKLIFVLNQIADPNLENRRTALKLLINRLDKGIDTDKKSNKVNISDLIQLTEDDLFILPPAFDIAVIDVPGEEIYRKEVIKQNPALNFALKCSLLRVSIFEKLEENTTGERPSFTSMSEWLDMAGETWKTIIKFQDIVKFRNFNEMHLHKELKSLVDKMIKEHFYAKKKDINKIVEEYSTEILNFDSKSASELWNQIELKIQKFEDYFYTLRIKCKDEFQTSAENLPESQLIHREHLEQLGRLITTEKLDYLITLKTQTNEFYNQRKRLECLNNFKKTVTNNISGYVLMETQGQNEEFERLWKESFQEDNLDELYRGQNLNDFYLMFSSEWDLIPYQELIEIYKRNEFKFEEVENILRTNLVENLKKNRQSEEPYFFPTKKSFPLKDIESHFYSNKLEYLNEGAFYYVHSTEGQESKFIRYFPNCKAIYKRNWVPEDCVPLLQSCSGYYPEHDINWKELSPSKQIIKLVTSLIRLYSWNDTPKFVQGIIADTAPFNDREITPVTIQQIADALDKRLTIFNHEISYIGAELTIHARRSIGTFVFSRAFTSYYKRKWEVFSHNREKITTEKDSLKQYFLNKVEISKIIHSNTECASSVKYDVDIAKKYVTSFITSLYETIAYELYRKIREQLMNKQEFEYENITLEAEEMISQALISDAHIKNIGETHFVVKYICERNDSLREIFEKRWEEYIKSNSSSIIGETVEDAQNEINIIIEQLTTILHFLDIEDKSLLNSEKCFKPCEEQPKDCDEFQLNESPYRSMVFYLRFAMNPGYTTEEIQELFGKEFECNHIKMKLHSDLLLRDDVLGCFKIPKMFVKLKRANFFHSELIFNLHSFIKSFHYCLNTRKMTISNHEFLEIISTNKDSMLRNSLGCTKQCPCCGKFCDRINHGQMRCSSSGHQFASMGGKTWANDKQHSAVFTRCEDYTNEMTVALPGRLIKWREFKRTTERAWDWQEDNGILQTELDKRKENMIKIWDKFGKGILEFQRVHRGANIAFRPYEEKDLKSESDITKYQLCFVIDGTGSMGKDIEKVRDSVRSLVNSYKNTRKDIYFRIVIYRDHCDETDGKLIETCPKGNRFISSDETIVNFLDNVIPEGGGDVPEASLDGLAVALSSIWDKGDQTRRIIIHSFDAPPHGNFPDYKYHNTNSNPNHCCCCSGKCRYDWQEDVWKKLKKLEVEYHGINTGDSHWVEFENTMKRELDYLCKGFTKCGKEQVSDAVMQIFINYQCELEDDDDQDNFKSLAVNQLMGTMFPTMSWNH